MADGVDQALDQEGGFRAAGAAIGVDRDGVGEDGLHFDVDRGRLVGAGEEGAVEVGWHGGGEGGEVGAHVGQGGDL